MYGIQVKYAPQLPFVLKGLTCILPGGMKTGIVGRTGGGKSTLIQALFRIIDPCIGLLIDGIDISTIGLHDLRTRLSIIPQDPVMFKGTLRSNIDPLNEYSDEQIWEVLLNFNCTSYFYCFLCERIPYLIFDDGTAEIVYAFILLLSRHWTPVILDMKLERLEISLTLQV